MKALGAVLLSLCLAGCGGQSGENDLERCERPDRQNVDADDTTLGFSAEEALAALARPVSVRWDAGEMAGTEDPVTMDVRIDGQVELVDFTEAREPCDLGRELRIPVTADIDIGDGGIVVTDARFDVWAAGVGPTDVFPSTGLGLPVELSGPYEAAFDAWWAEQQATYPDVTDWELEGVYLMMVATWDSPSVAVDADYLSSNGDGRAMMWYGDFVAAE
jgi:hypothetical protein